MVHGYAGVRLQDGVLGGCRCFIAFFNATEKRKTDEKLFELNSVKKLSF